MGNNIKYVFLLARLSEKRTTTCNDKICSHTDNRFARIFKIEFELGSSHYSILERPTLEQSRTRLESRFSISNVAAAVSCTVMYDCTVRMRYV